ncbi:MAG: hypothetical protein IPP74_07845 [Alphaproteobacteria bacterium]|nr:hypothetical protein [Alphaproteobacteria bacterium]
MVAFNFIKAQIKKVESGEKCATIRPTRRAKPGDTLQLYTGLRTRKARMLKVARCTDVRKITVFKDRIEGIEEYDDAEFLEMMGCEEDSMEEFISYFEKHCTLPYTCYLYIWAELVTHTLKG